MTGDRELGWLKKFFRLAERAQLPQMMMLARKMHRFRRQPVVIQFEQGQRVRLESKK